MAKKEENKKNVQRFVNSLAIACNVNDEVKQVQIVITADVDNNLHCYFDVLDPTKLPKFAE